MISSAALDMSKNLSEVILNHNDSETIRQGAPAYLLMMDSFVKKDPENEQLLIQASKLYGAYADAFTRNNPQRSKKLSDRALNYGADAMCAARDDACELQTIVFADFEKKIQKMEKKDLPALFALGAAWGIRIKAHKSDWNAIADISRVESIMKKIKSMDDTYEKGAVHLYLGMMSSFLPPAMGGKPEEGRKNFERAIEISKGENLMIKVVFARQYARLVFDRDLHDRLLKEVIEAKAEEGGIPV
ncbi:TRAP transporter TatT component family protein [Desulfobacterales bacterium HSG16]|nr:TRAP transporter TatT component family protein [Desulfobacterales bacterium HSG16]